MDKGLKNMKINLNYRVVLWGVFKGSLLLIILFATRAETYATPEKPLRVLQVMKDRAETITRLKNEFVKKLLDSYRIPYEADPKGVILRIKMDGQWKEVKVIEIVPEVKDGQGGIQRITHNIYFYVRSGEVLHLTSEINIKP